MTLPAHRRTPLRLACLLAIPLLQTWAQDAPYPVAIPVPLPSAHNRSAAEGAYLRAAKLLQAGDYTAAEQQFSRATELNPTRPEYIDGLLVAREHHVTSLLQQAALERPLHPDTAASLLEQARRLDSTNPRVTQRAAPTAPPPPPTAPVRTERLAGTIALQPNASTHSYHQRGDTRSLATQIAADYGLRAAFDSELATKPLRLDADDLSATEALRILNLLSGTMQVALDAHTFLLAADTPENRKRYERLVEETFYLPGLQADQLKDFVSIAQQLLDIRQVSVAPLGGALVLRGRSIA